MSGQDVYVWQVFEEGEWGAIAVAVLSSRADNLVPLYCRSKDVALKVYKSAALLHHEQTGLPIRLARLNVAEVMESYP